MRLIAPDALLYTEMHTPAAIKHNPIKTLAFSAIEHPLALQLGGSEKAALVEAAQKGEQLGFVEINLNLGCPSSKVQAGKFGACLMKEDSLAAECIAAMKQAVSIPVTAKTRIGVDDEDSYEFFSGFIKKLESAGCDKLIVHARKAWLNGLNPKQNRTIPPLHYDYAWRIKKEFPDLPVVINGNIKTADETALHMNHVDGVMVGRLACDNPYALTALQSWFHPEKPVKSRQEIMGDYLPYLMSAVSGNVPLSLLIKPLLNFAHGVPNSKFWKAQLLLAQRMKETGPLLEACRWLEREACVVS